MVAPLVASDSTTDNVLVDVLRVYVPAFNENVGGATVVAEGLMVYVP
jgi:hypothetical protein